MICKFRMIQRKMNGDYDYVVQKSLSLNEFDENWKDIGVYGFKIGAQVRYQEEVDTHLNVYSVLQESKAFPG